MGINQDWALNALRVIGELRESLGEAQDGWSRSAFARLHEATLKFEESEYPEPDETANPEYPVEGTPLNPNEREEMEHLMKEANESIQELYAVIAPLRDLGFERLNGIGKLLDSPIDEGLKRVGEVVDRANEYFNGR